ncbi:MAG: threonine--tRNA ligase, partial [Acidobacteriota bacterium]
LDYEINEGDGAFYGPKIDFQAFDALGRSWQLGTIQLDYQMPERFELSYVGADGDEHVPVLIHRAMLGSVERFMGILIEHTAGAFPAWLSPVQAMVIPVSDRFLDYASDVQKQLEDAGLRAEVDVRSEKLGYKIREAQLQKVPYMLIVGEREVESGTVAVRQRDGVDLGSLSVPDWLEGVQPKLEARSLEL